MKTKMKRGLMGAVVVAALMGLGGCSTLQSAMPVTVTKAACGVGGGLAMHALTGGASTAWRAAATVLGFGGGSYACGQL
jgi:hypothetical protein